MKFKPMGLEGSYVIDVDPFADERGWFARYYCKNEFREIGHDKEWVQFNHSVTLKKGAIRGMHYQQKPFGEIKMVKCISGKVFDVIIDLRSGSKTFLKWEGLELSTDNKRLIYIPEGFAHGFQCLEDNCQLIYHHTAYYTPTSEGAIRFDDPLVNIEWPLEVTDISPRDATHPYLDETFKGF